MTTTGFIRISEILTNFEKKREALVVESHIQKSHGTITYELQLSGWHHTSSRLELFALVERDRIRGGVCRKVLFDANGQLYCTKEAYRQSLAGWGGHVDARRCTIIVAFKRGRFLGGE